MLAPALGAEAVALQSKPYGADVYVGNYFRIAGNLSLIEACGSCGSC